MASKKKKKETSEENEYPDRKTKDGTRYAETSIEKMKLEDWQEALRSSDAKIKIGKWEAEWGPDGGLKQNSSDEFSPLIDYSLLVDPERQALESLSLGLCDYLDDDFYNEPHDRRSLVLPTLDDIMYILTPSVLVKKRDVAAENREFRKNKRGRVGKQRSEFEYEDGFSDEDPRVEEIEDDDDDNSEEETSESAGLDNADSAQINDETESKERAQEHDPDPKESTDATESPKRGEKNSVNNENEETDGGETDLDSDSEKAPKEDEYFLTSPILAKGDSLGCILRLKNRFMSAGYGHSGAVRDKRPHGFGVTTYDSGTVYSGEFYRGSPHRDGVCKRADGKMSFWECKYGAIISKVKYDPENERHAAAINKAKDNSDKANALVAEHKRRKAIRAKEKAAMFENEILQAEARLLRMQRKELEEKKRKQMEKNSQKS
eukprot:m.63773 g.63773  ORF g.63773 m.63773 type:complete len:434 (-) comp11599_c0_seq1:180-1481(-)